MQRKIDLGNNILNKVFHKYGYAYSGLLITILISVEECLRERGIQEGLIPVNARILLLARLTVKVKMQVKIVPDSLPLEYW